MEFHRAQICKPVYSRGATRKGHTPAAEQKFSVDSAPDPELPRGSPTALRIEGIFTGGLPAHLADPGFEALLPSKVSK